VKSPASFGAAGGGDAGGGAAGGATCTGGRVGGGAAGCFGATNRAVKSPGSGAFGVGGGGGTGAGAAAAGLAGAGGVGDTEAAPNICVNSPAGGAGAAAGGCWGGGGACRGGGAMVAGGGPAPFPTAGSGTGAAMPLLGLAGARVAGAPFLGEITTVASSAGGRGGSGGGGVSPGRGDGGSGTPSMPARLVIHASRLTKLCSIFVTMIGTPLTSRRSTMRCFFSSGRYSTSASRSRLGWSGSDSKWCSITIAFVAVRMASTERTGALVSCLSGPYRALSSSGVIAAG